MSNARSITSEVEVALDPASAFKVFTEEMDLWWVRSPISFYDGARAVAQKCEAGVGGRLLEVYDESAGDVLELGRITVWEPGSRLGWHSSVDDVEIEVRFQPTDAGTNVSVHARIPAGGRDRGGTAWVGVVPPWFGSWVARRDTAPHEPLELARLALAISYAKPAAAARWLASVFGFELIGTFPADDDDGGATGWTEFHIGNAALILFKLDGDRAQDAPRTHVPWVYVNDLDAHYAHAARHGATIVQEIHQHGYRAYVADDLEGHRWTFAQANPKMV
jgi:uncharacterized glyoxalase superfamily protein PhnB